MIGILTTDTRLIICSWDDRLAEMTGIAAADATGRHIADLVPDLAERGLRARFENVLNRGTNEVLAPAFHHYLLRCPPRQPATHFDVMQQRVTIAPIIDEARVVGTIVAIEDVTSRLDQERTLVEQLKSPDEQTRLQATRELESADGAAPALVELLGDPSWRVRRNTVESLGRTADAGSIAEVLRVLRSEHHNPAVLNSALQILALNQVDVVPALAEFLHDADVDLRLYAALALGYQADERAEVALIGVLHDLEPNVVYHAIEALGRLRAQAAVEELVVVAKSRDFFLSFPAIEALTQIGDSRVAEQLLPLLDDELLCEAAIDALSQLGDLEVVGPLAQVLNEQEKPAALVCRALVNLHDRYQQIYGQADYIAGRVRRTVTPVTAERLIALLDRADEHDLRSLARVLGWLDGPGIDAALCGLLQRAEIRDDIVDICAGRGASLVDHLLAHLASGDLETREATLDILGRIGDPRATPALIEVLQSEPELLSAAVDALARTGDRRAFEPILSLLGHADLGVRQAVIAAINSLGHPDTSSRLTELMRDPHPQVRESAVSIAGYYGYPECADALLECTADVDERVRLAAIEQLPFLDDARVLPVFLAALRQDTPRVRAAAARAGGSLDGAEVGPALVSALEDPVPWVRYAVARSLAKRGESTAFDLLAQIVETDPAPQVRIAALEALGAIGGQRAIGLLETFISAEDSDVACAALSGLGATHNARALPALRSALRSVEPRRRTAAIQALAEIRTAEAVEVLQWVAAVDHDAATDAVAALGEIRSPAAIAALLSLLAEPAQRHAAGDALVRAGPGEIKEIALGLQRPEPSVRRAVVEILARMRHPSTSQVLEGALDDPSAAVRLAAVHGLAYLKPQGTTEKLRLLAATDEDPSVRRAAHSLLEP